jgi:hypothetical protein
VIVYRSKACVRLFPETSAHAKSVEYTTAEAIHLAVTACVKAEGGQANLPKYHAKLASVLQHFAGFGVKGKRWLG